MKKRQVLNKTFVKIDHCITIIRRYSTGAYAYNTRYYLNGPVMGTGWITYYRLRRDWVEA